MAGLNNDQKATVTVLLRSGKTVKEISNFADLPKEGVTEIARQLDLEPPNKVMKRAKELFGSDEGLTYAEVAERLQAAKLTNDGQPVHYLTVATWVNGYGWPWGGAADGDYAPVRTGSNPARSRYTLRLSETLSAELNGSKAIREAADAAWEELQSDRTRIVAQAVVRGAAASGATDIGAVKKELMDRHGEAIRAAKS